MRLILPVLITLLSLPVQAVELSGIAEFDKRLTLNSSISARIERIHVEIGQRVAAGDLLVSMVSTGLQASVDIASAETEALLPELELTQIELNKAQELYDRDSLALVSLQRAQQNQRVAEARLAAARAKLELSRFHRAQAAIRSPIDGIVLSIDAFPGQYINTRVENRTLLTVADNRSMSVKALLPVEQYRKTLLNKPAQVGYLKQSFRGRVITIDRQVSMGANNHPAMFVQVQFSTDGTLPAGLPVQISIDDKQ